MTTNMSNAHKFALKKYPVKVIKNTRSIDVNASKRKEAEKIYHEVEKDIIDRAEEWFKIHVGIDQEVETTEDGEPLAVSYADYAIKRLEVAQEILEDFKKFIRGE